MQLILSFFQLKHFLPLHLRFLTFLNIFSLLPNLTALEINYYFVYIQKVILELRFGLNGIKPKTQNEIAEMMNISRSYVSRIETKAIWKLSKEIKE